MNLKDEVKTRDVAIKKIKNNTKGNFIKEVMAACDSVHENIVQLLYFSYNRKWKIFINVITVQSG